MRALVVLCLLVAAASAQLSTSNLEKARVGCSDGAPGDAWVKVSCNEIDEEAKKVALGEGAEYLGATRLAGIVGAHHYAVHAKVNGKCCQQRVAKIAGTSQAHPYKIVEQSLCCYDSCPEWMKC